MSTSQDHAWGMKRESTYGVAVTVDRFYPFVKGTDADWDPDRRTSQGVLGGNGRRTQLGARSFLAVGQGSLTTVVELESKAAGVLLDIAFGVSTVTAITGGAQMNFHTGVAGMVLPSATIQIQKIRNDGSVYTETYRGCTPTKVTLQQSEDDIPTLSVDWDALGRSTATGAATVTYATAPTLFDADQAVCGYAGTLTAPTTTALATGLTAAPIFRSWKIDIDHKAATDRLVLNGGVRLQPTVGAPDIKFTGEVEFQDGAIPDAFVAGTKSAWYTTYTTPEALGAGNTQLQVVAPLLVLTKGIPQVDPGVTPTTIGVEAMVLNDGTNRDLYVVYRTTDTVL